jgi:hypothetical protein
MKSRTSAAFLVCLAGLTACAGRGTSDSRQPLRSSGWIEDAAGQRGYIKPGDIAQFGCPSGWLGVEDTAAALRGREVATTYRGTDPPPREGTLTCVAQQEFALPSPYPSPSGVSPSPRPLAPVWLKLEPDKTTIGFRREVPASAALFIGQDTPCGPRLVGVRLGDLLKWLSDPRSATKRDFLGLVSAGCPDQNQP